MNLKERIRVLANSKGMSLPNLESELGFGNGTILKWDKSAPNTDKLSKVADYFGVSIDYLLGRELTEKDEKDISKDLEGIMAKIQNKEDGPLHFEGEVIDDESLLLLRDALNLGLRQLKLINKEKYNPNKNKK